MKHLSRYGILSTACTFLLLICGSMCCSMFVSCDNESLAEVQPTFDYFEGIVNNKPIKLEEKDKNHPMFFQDYTITDDDGIVTYGFRFRIPEINNLLIVGYLSPLTTPQLYEIGADYNPVPYTTITAYIKENNKKYRAEKEPFKIYVDTIVSTKDNPEIPGNSARISGRMEGVLYNVKNPQDSISFQNVKFRIWNR